MENQNLSLLTELVKENMKQVAELRSSFDQKMEVLSDRVISRVEDLEDSVHGRVDGIEEKVQIHTEKLSSYEHASKMMKNVAIAISGSVTVLAGILAVVATFMGLVHPNAATTITSPLPVPQQQEALKHGQ